MTAQPWFDPLPVPTRRIGGEGVGTYSTRLSHRNGSTVKDIERAVYEQGYCMRALRLAPERLALWRQLGNLHSSAFKTPQIMAGFWVSDRVLCLRCAGGVAAYGQLPLVGNVCLRHHRWIGGGPQTDLAGYQAAMTAERGFRSHLATRSIVFDAPAMLVGLSAATAALSTQEIERRRLSSGTDRIEVLTYPEQVRFARLLALPSLMNTATDPKRPGEVRHDLVDRAVNEVIADNDENEVWRARTRIWNFVIQLTENRLNATPAAKALETDERNHF